MTEKWHSGLCDCFVDRPICCLSFFCPCVQYGLNESALGETGPVCCVLYGALMHFYCCCLLHAPMRGRLRQRYGLAGDDGSDVLATLTGCMSIAQEAREIKARGPPPPVHMLMPAARPVVALQVIRPSAASPLPPPVYTEKVVQPPQVMEKEARADTEWVTQESGTEAIMLQSPTVENEADAEAEHEWVTDGASGTCPKKRAFP